MVLIVSHGYDEKDTTSKMRHKITKLPANSYAKVELIQPELFKLNNEFKVSFFEENSMFDKVEIAGPGFINLTISTKFIEETLLKGYSS